MRVALLVCCSITALVGTASAADSPAPAPAPAPALLAVENASNVDLAFELAVDGQKVPGCFWVLRGKSTTFELPAGKLGWAYMAAGMQLSGSAVLGADAPKMLRCVAAQARTGDEIAKCSPATAPAPEALPAKDARAALLTQVVTFLEELKQKLDKSDAKAAAPMIDPPFAIEWGGDKAGKKQVKTAKQLIGLRARLELDAKALAAVKSRADDPRTGEDDCDKHEVDWSKGEPALSCDGRDVVLRLRPSKACGKAPRIDTWTARNTGGGWRFAGKGVVQP
ncbi:MAG: hypothetical protein HYZ29_36485 [Myxococcales bacterium]|nr:hypothetical protein [Myxococcales bacterium]